jgi:carnitine-CoA ligase
MRSTIGDTLRARAATDPDGLYVKCGGEWLSYRCVDKASDHAAAGLSALGVSKGDRIAFLVSTRQELIELFFACAKLGAVFVPLNIYLKGQFLEYQLSDCGATVLVVDQEGFDAAAGVLDATEIHHLIAVDPISRPASVTTTAYTKVRECGEAPPRASRSPRDLAAILYTSGTSGPPKGCMIPDGYLVQLPEAQRENEWVVPGDRIFTSYPMYHISGVSALLSALINEASVCFEPTFSASRFMSQAKMEGATVVYGVGSMAAAILAQEPGPNDSEFAFRMALWVPLTVELQREFERRFSTPVIADAYGQTEVSPLSMSSLHGPRKPNTSGRCVSYLQIAIVDDADMEVPNGTVGEIVVRPATPDVMFFLGYWGNPESTISAFRNLWHHTGDYGTIDDDGFITFVDRKKDSLRRRGENVSSFELEAAIRQHPSIEQVAVTGVPSPLGEDDILASIVCTPGNTVDLDGLFVFLRDNLPYYAIPRYVDVRDSLPVNAMGRVMKHVLRSEGLPATAWDFEAVNLTVSKEQRRR